MTIYCFDIDHTICTQRDGGDYENAEPFFDRIDKINKLFDKGHYIIYMTARGMGRHNGDKEKAIEHFYDFTEAQLVEWGCHFHELHLGKPMADYFVDDKGVNTDDFFG